MLVVFRLSPGLKLENQLVKNKEVIKYNINEKRGYLPSLFILQACIRLKTYTYRICTKKDEEVIAKLNNIGVGISGISSFTGISKANVINKMKKIASEIKRPEVTEDQQEYEVDEMHTFVRNKKNGCYITYALNKKTKRIIDMVVGSRTKENIGKLIKRLLALNPKQIYTDKLNVHPGLIDKSIHTASSYKINHIERFNLTLRTHLKRLTRKTICFSKSIEMLESCLRIYLWDSA